MVPDSRKLKRGLKDISPFFGGETPPASGGVIKNQVVLPADIGTPIMNVSCVSSRKNSHFLNTYLASQFASEDHPCSMISIRKDNAASPPEEFFGAYLRRFALPWSQFWEICSTHDSFHPEEAKGKNSILFLDFDCSNPIYFQKTIPLLDKWILLVEPTMESLSETFKMMKASIPLNGRLDYFLLFAGSVEKDKAGLLYERFSEIIAKRLGINLGWLGCVNASKGFMPYTELALNYLFLKPMSSLNSTEKKALMDFVHFSNPETSSTT